MRLLFKQRFFSWFDSYDIYNEAGETVFTVKGELSWGHCLRVYDSDGRELGRIKEKVLSFLPQFEIYLKDEYIGRIKKQFTFFVPRFSIDFNGWSVEGNWLEWDYKILNSGGQIEAAVSKELFHLTDTYVIDVYDEEKALEVLMTVLAIDAEKCSRG